MRQIFKDCKKGGMRGAKARFTRKLLCIAGLLVLAVAAMCFASGNMVGAGAGTVIMATAGLAFVMPEGMSENSQKGIKAVIDHVNAAIGDATKGIVTHDQIAKLIADGISEKMKGAGPDEIKKIIDSLNTQGIALAKLGKGGGSGEVKTIGDFFKSDKWRDGVANVKNKVTPFEVELQADKATVTTGNVTPPTPQPTLSLLGDNGELYRIDRSQGDSLMDAVTVGRTDRATLTWVDEVPGTGDVATVAEGGAKPNLDVKFVEKVSNAIKKAGHVKVTEEALDDISFMQGVIISVLGEKLNNQVQADILTGITDAATAYSTTAYDGAVPQANMVDAINAAIFQASATAGASFPTGVIMNPIDVGALQFVKDSSGQPVLTYSPDGKLPSLRNGIRIFMRKDQPVGQFIVGDFKKYHVDVYKQKVVWGWENDDLTKNLRTVVAEERYHRYISANQTGSFISGTFATIIAQINKVAA